MKNERLLHALGQVEENYIEEAAPKGMQENQKTQTKKSNAGKYAWVKWGALAACVCIVAGISMKAAVLTGPDDEVLDSIVHQNNTAINEETVNSNTVINPTIGQEKQFSSTGSAALDDEGLPNWGLTLSVKDVTSTGLTLVCTQSGGEPTGTIETGDPYKLITLVNGTWKTVEELPLPEGVDARAWHQIAYPIPMGNSREFEINWSWIYGELPEGTYRLVKEFMDFRETGDYDTFDYWVEFDFVKSDIEKEQITYHTILAERMQLANSFEELENISDVIVKATVAEGKENIIKAMPNDPNLIYNGYTKTVLKIEEVIKGDVTSDELTITEEYYTLYADDEKQVWSQGNYLPAEEGKTYLFFLKQYEDSSEYAGMYYPIDLELGKYPVNGTEKLSLVSELELKPESETTRYEEWYQKAYDKYITKE